MHVLLPDLYFHQSHIFKNISYTYFVSSAVCRLRAVVCGREMALALAKAAHHRQMSIASSSFSSSPFHALEWPRTKSSQPGGAPARAEASNLAPTSRRLSSIQRRARVMTGYALTRLASTRRAGSLRSALFRSSTSSVDRPERSTWAKSSCRIRCHASPLQSKIRYVMHNGVQIELTGLEQ